jgi:DNA-binding NtrC family response regulator
MKAIERPAAPAVARRSAPPDVILVEPNLAIADVLHEVVARSAPARCCCDFVTARHMLHESPPALIVTNLRLGMYNGLHLVYLARSFAPRTRCIVYTAVPDLTAAREAVAAGAFYELQDQLPHSLSAYLKPLRLPAHDRRRPPYVDRRLLFRGGRRAADQPGTESHHQQLG